MATMTEKESKFTQFKNLTNLFSTEKNEIEQRKDKISIKVSGFLIAKQFDVVLDYMQAGYILNKQQDSQFIEGLNNEHITSSTTILNKAVQNGVHFSDSMLVHFLPIYIFADNFNKHYNTNIDNPYTEFKEMYKEKIDKLDFTSYYQNWVKSFNLINSTVNSFFARQLSKKLLITEGAYMLHNSNDLTKKVLEPLLEYGQYMFKNIDLNVIMKHIKTADKISKKIDKLNNRNDVDRIYRNITNELNLLPKKIYSNDLENDKKEIGLLYAEDNINQLIAENDLKISSQNNVKNLPEKAKSILDEIKDNYLSLNKKIADLNDDEKFTIENMWTKRIPEVINKYLRADPEFRSTMKNNRGQSIEDLMIDSLNNIHTTFKDIKVTHGENALRDMSAINRYTKTLKK